MKIVILTALLAAVAYGRATNDNLEQQTQWPWQVGKLYTYDVHSHTLSRLHEGPSAGTAFRGTFIVRAKAPGRLQARFSNLQRALVHQDLPDRNQRTLPEGLRYEPVKYYQDMPFEMQMEGGRFTVLNMPSSMNLAHENLLKGLISNLQVDLSNHRSMHNSQNFFDRESFQGQFRKMEVDVTGDCETLYTVSPADSEWRHQWHSYVAVSEDPIVVTKSKNYGHCHHRVGYHFGVPEAAEWTGTADESQEQFMNRASNSRIYVGKQGLIYKAETTNTINVHPYVYGKQKAEVMSYVKMTLAAFEEDNEPEWEAPKNRVVQSLLYSMTSKQAPMRDSSEESYEESEHAADESNEQENRVRRSLKIKTKIEDFNKRLLNRRNDDSDADDSSSSDSTSAYINDETLDNNEPAYAALYMQPQTHKATKQNPEKAHTLVQEMAQLLQNTNNMPKSDFLSKFNVLVRVIASMDSEQLTQTSRSILLVKASNNVVKADTWMIYRDAVTQAGSLPAFKQIVSWIQTRKIEGEEAAQVLASLPSTLRYPTKSTMMQFFELAMSSEVKQQQFLNSTALIAATKFINMGQVNNDTAHSFYPTHMYGRLARQHDKFVLEEVLPRLAQELEQAVQQQDNHKAQVYIKAIGNLGHPSILDVFAPYLEGKIHVSTYLRAMMVENLITLAYEKDPYTRAALYSIIRNTAEPDDVRLVAIQNIFVAHPTSSMMQAMAQMTHDDPSVQVRAAIKSSIDNAAKLVHPRYLSLARKAQAAQPMLTKFNFGAQYASKKYSEYFDSDSELGIMSAMSTIGSDDSILPKYVRYIRRSQTRGWDSILASMSNVQKLVKIFQNPFAPEPRNAEHNHEYSAKKISEMLKIQREHQNPLEAALYIGLWNQERYFTFDEQDLKQLPITIFEELKKGVDVHYTKVYNQAQISVMFPLASGMPFIYKYKEPTVVHIQAKAKHASHAKDDFEVKGEIQFTYARNIDGSVGFLDTLTNQVASAGQVNKLQMNIPVKVELEMNKETNKVRMHVQHLRPEQDTLLVHYSVWPYTTIQKKDTLVPISLDPATKVFTRSKKVVSTDTRFGQFADSEYQFQGYSYSSDYRNVIQMLQSPNVLTNIITAVYQRDVASTHFNLRYLGSKSQSKGVTFTAIYNTLYKWNKTPVVIPETQDEFPNSEERRNRLINEVASEFQPRVQVVDFDMAFDGPKKLEFVLTVAVSVSPVDSKIQYAFFAGKNSAQGNKQIRGAGKINRPESISMNAQEALQKELKVDFEFGVYGARGSVDIKGQAMRSKQYTEALQRVPFAKVCAEQMKKNNFYQSPCHKMIIMAQTPDNFKASVRYNGETPLAEEMTYPFDEVYKFAKRFGFWNINVNNEKQGKEFKFDVEVQNDYLENFMDVTIYAPLGEIKVRNVPIPRGTEAAFANYSPIRPYERFANLFTNHLYQPFCTVDGGMVRTFSGRSYHYALSPAWHVVMQDAPSDKQQRDKVVVLARRSAEKQLEVYISYESESNKDEDMEINIKPTSGKPVVEVKTKAAREENTAGEYVTYWERPQMPLLQHYTLGDDVQYLKIRENRLRVMYDGQRVVVLARDGRNTTRGICGLMSGDIRDDFWTPQGLVDSEEHFGASYALQEGIDEKTQQLKSEAPRRVYQRQYKPTNILKSDNEWQRWLNKDLAEDSWKDWSSQRVYRTRSHVKQPRGTCVLAKQVQMYETSSDICITTTPLEACSSHCKGEGYRVQAVEVVCKPRMDQRFQQYVNEINKGQSPQVSGDTQTRQYRVPTTCRA